MFDEAVGSNLLRQRIQRILKSLKLALGQLLRRAHGVGRALAFDGNGRQMRDLSNNSLLLWSRTAWFAREHGETPQDFTLGRKNRRGPARLQPVREGQSAIFVP